MRKTTVTNYLLAALVAHGTGDDIEAVLDRAYKYCNSTDDDEPKSVISDADVDAIYAAYPTRDPKCGRSTNKSSACKNKIKSLLKTKSKDYILAAIDAYISDCTAHDVYFKNFGTFLNNLPDIQDEVVAAYEAIRNNKRQVSRYR